MKPYLFQLARRDEHDRWRCGFNCGEIVFNQDFILLGNPGKDALLTSNAFRMVAGAVQHHFSLPETEQAKRVRKANALYRDGLMDPHEDVNATDPPTPEPAAE